MGSVTDELTAEMQKISDCLDCKLAHCLGIDYNTGTNAYINSRVEEELFLNCDTKLVKSYKE
jgi:hypothetical protein